MPAVIKHYGTLNNARNVDGEQIQRESHLFLKTHNQWYPCLPTDNHFVYKSNRIGSSVLCTCGSEVVVVGYKQYKQYQSWIGNEVLMCKLLATHGRHADGST